MNIYPDYDEFVSQSASNRMVPVFADLTADSETPVSAYCKLRRHGPSFLLESVVGGERMSRYSFVGANPRKVISSFENKTKIRCRQNGVSEIDTPSDPLALVETEMLELRCTPTPGMPPFTGGAVGFVGHEFIHTVEPTIPRPSRKTVDTPDMFYMFTDTVLIFDHVRQILRICNYVDTETASLSEAYNHAKKSIFEVADSLARSHSLKTASISKSVTSAIGGGNFTQQEFENAVHKIQEYVRSGDVIQTVLSQQFSKAFLPEPVQLYRALRTINPSPYMFLLEDDGFAAVGASPEVHVRLTNDDVEIRPIAGTRHRSSKPEEDLALERDLLDDEKEKAEHLMLVDLARNDIGRVCEYGSVEVRDFMSIERYSHVMHIVSQVTGKIRDGANAFDLLRATFPAGTLSGAPKVRALQIISELEKSQRGIYGGALGYFGYDGNHDSCIGIRTAVIQNKKIYIQSGAGVVADSDAQSEFQETINKANALFTAVALAEAMDEASDD